MDKITKSLLDDFTQSQSLKMEESSAFERFANYCVLSRDLSETFDIEDVSTGGGGDNAIDGIAILVNGALVTTTEELEDLVEANKHLDLTFIFIQSKTSSNFSGAEISNFLFGVKDFFSDTPEMVQNDFIKQRAEIQRAAYARSALMTRGKPVCRAYYVTTGEWKDDKNLRAHINDGTKSLKDLKIFRSVECFPIDADGLHKLYQQTKNRVSAEFSFPQKCVLPEIKGVSEAYLGILPVKDYLPLISDDTSGIRKPLFYDNVRDFQDYNEVNKEIQNTLRSEQDRGRFALLNNGITIIARSLRTVGNRFFIEDYQIVNGCQTSHVLYDERANIGDSVYVPIKIIATTDEGITNAIIKCTNRQTEVKEEQLYALSEFQKKLEAFFAAYPEKKRLHYERRSRQYNSAPDVEKVRIITMTQQIRVFSSMFLDEPHRATKNYWIFCS